MSHSINMLKALERKDIQRANKEFKKALEEDDTKTLFALGEDLDDLGFTNKSKTVFELVLERNPKNDAARLYLASAYVDDGDFDTAFEYLDDINEDSDEILAKLVLEADMYQAMNMPEVAINKLVLAQEKEPKSVILTMALADVLMDEQQFTQAIKEYSKVDPKEVERLLNESLYEKIGVAYSYLGKYERAIEFLEKAVEDGWDSQEIYFHLAVLSNASKENDKALKYFEKVDEQDEGYESYELAWAKTLLEEERRKEALDVLKKGIHKNPYNAEMYQFASRLAYSEGDVDLAEVYLLEAITLDELRDENLIRLMNLYDEQGRERDLLKAFDELEDKENGLANWMVAKTFVKHEKYEMAEEFFETAKRTLASDFDFVVDYVQYLRMMGQIKDAKAFVEHISPDFTEEVEFAQLREEMEEW